MISDWPLTGRAEEFRLISDAIRGVGEYRHRDCRRCRRGKTRLAREALAVAAARGMRTRWIVASQSAQILPLGAFAEVACDFGTDPMCRVREVVDALVGNGPEDSVVIGIDDAHLLDDLSALVVQQLAPS